MRIALAVALALLVVGCGKTEKSGKVGETLKAGQIAVTVQRIDPAAPVRDDVTGLGRPSAGNSLIGVRVRVCVGEGAAIGSTAFGLDVSAGDARLKFPATNYSDRFAAVFAGDCGEGWLVFEAQVGAVVKAVTLAYDDTGGGSPRRRETHARFRWAG
jgi:hypothetical protein